MAQKFWDGVGQYIDSIEHSGGRYKADVAAPMGRPPKKAVVRYRDYMCRAASWDQLRRVGAKGEWHRAGTPGNCRIEQKITKEAKRTGPGR